MIKLAVLAITIGIVMGVPRPEDDHYKSRLDHIDVDVALNNTRLTNNYIKCALDKIPCTGEAKEIKEQVLDGLIPEILETNCAKCTEEQKSKVKKILRFLHDKRPEDYKAILEKYDPKGELRAKYKERYATTAKEEGFQDLFAEL